MNSDLRRLTQQIFRQSFGTEVPLDEIEIAGMPVTVLAEVGSVLSAQGCSGVFCKATVDPSGAMFDLQPKVVRLGECNGMPIHHALANATNSYGRIAGIEYLQWLCGREASEIPNQIKEAFLGVQRLLFPGSALHCVGSPWSVPCGTFDHGVMRLLPSARPLSGVYGRDEAVVLIGSPN